MELLRYENGKPLKYEMGLSTHKRHGVTATRHGRGRRRHGVGEWVSVSLSTLYLYSVSPLYLSVPLTSLSFFPLFPSFSAFSVWFWTVESESWVFFFFLRFTWVMGSWAVRMMGSRVHDFWEGGRAKNSGGAGLKTQGPKPFFLKILLAKKKKIWTQGGPGPP